MNAYLIILILTMILLTGCTAQRILFLPTTTTTTNLCETTDACFQTNNNDLTFNITQGDLILQST